MTGSAGGSFTPHPERPRPLLIGEGAGIAAMIFLVERLRARADAEWQPLVLMGCESPLPFPFRPRPSRIVVAGMPDGCIASMPLLEEWGVASRLASRDDFPGCFDGRVTELAQTWLQGLSAAGLADVEIFACGPTSMLEGAAGLARRFAVPCQVLPPGV